MKEVEAHINDEHWKVVKKSEVPPETDGYPPSGQCEASKIS